MKLGAELFRMYSAAFSLIAGGQRIIYARPSAPNSSRWVVAWQSSEGFFAFPRPKFDSGGGDFDQ
jgi:hypothetical protein